MTRKYTIRSKKEKLEIVKRVLRGEVAQRIENEAGIDHHVIQRWIAKYLAEGEDGLEPKKKPGNPLSRYERRKELSYTEQLQYEIELLKRDLLKKEAEVTRLKKLNARKEGDARRK